MRNENAEMRNSSVMKKHKNKIIAGVVIAAALAASFFLIPGGGGMGGENPMETQTVDSLQNTETAVPDATITDSVAPLASDNAPPYNTPQTTDVGEATPDEPTPAQPTQTQPAPQETDATPDPSTTHLPQDRPQETTPSADQQGSGDSLTDNADEEMTVKLIITCATILDNMDRLSTAKVELVPASGVIFSATVVFYEGESVFNVLQREMRSNRIHLEFMNTPMYNSAYIEGINNLYEFDCGEGSGWMYSVNGVFPNYGSSRYSLQNGDTVVWHFTCDRGADIGGSDASGGYNFG